jgi:hypothetical protein
VVPSEIRAKHPKGLNVALADKRGEQYELPPPPKYISFSGQGTSFAQATTTPSQPNLLSKPQSCVNVDRSKEVTFIFIRFSNGQRE